MRHPFPPSPNGPTAWPNRPFPSILARHDPRRNTRCSTWGLPRVPGQYGRRMTFLPASFTSELPRTRLYFMIRRASRRILGRCCVACCTREC